MNMPQRTVYFQTRRYKAQEWGKVVLKLKKHTLPIEFSFKFHQENVRLGHNCKTNIMQGRGQENVYDTIEKIENCYHTIITRCYCLWDSEYSLLFFLHFLFTFYYLCYSDKHYSLTLIPWDEYNSPLFKTANRCYQYFRVYKDFSICTHPWKCSRK